MAKPFTKVRCNVCNMPVRVVDHIWNKTAQAFDYKLARHEHRTSSHLQRVQSEVTHVQPAKRSSWMDMFTFTKKSGRGVR
jgi:hypothetical protein